MNSSFEKVLVLQSSLQECHRIREQDKQKSLLKAFKEKRPVIYTKDENIYKGLIKFVYMDNPPEPYYDVQLENGAIKQTTCKYLKTE